MIVNAVTPRGRKPLKDSVLPFLRGVRTRLKAVAHSPVRMLAMFGGRLGRAVTDFAPFVIALAAFGSTPSIAALGAVCIGASVLGSASPTPGGVGAVEPALIAGLTGSASACRKPHRRCWSAGSSPLGSRCCRDGTRSR